MTSYVKNKHVASLWFLCALIFLSHRNLEASSDIFGDDQIARNQSFKHPKFGDIFGIRTYPISNFVGDSIDRVKIWKPGPEYYRYTVLPEEGIDTQKAYQTLDKLYRENHPDIACHFDNIMDKDGPSIPLITHSIWLTNLDNPVELTNDFIIWFKLSCKMNSFTAGWKHYLWVQDKHKLPRTVRELESAGIEVKEVYRTLPDESSFCGLKPHFDQEVSQSKFGRASDILRCILLKKFGGFYRDIDYTFTRPLTGLALAYDFVAGIEPPYSYPCNATMGCREGHPIIVQLIEIMSRNYDPKKAPNYVKEAFNVGGERLSTLCLTGPIAFGVAVKKIILQGTIAHGLPIKALPDGRRDRNIVFPPEVFFGHTFSKDGYSFGWHAFTGTWLKGEFGSNG